MKCAKLRCTAEATHAIRAEIPPRGHPTTPTNTLNVVIGIKLCCPHAHKVDGELLTADTKSVLTGSLRALGRAEPDFSRAKFVLISLDSTEYLSFESMQATKQ